MKIKIDGVELVAAENILLGEMCEAEKELGFAADETGFAGRMMLELYVTLRRLEPEKPMAVTAEEVRNVDMTKIEEVEEEDPPAEEDDGNAAAPAVLPTIGPRPSALSA